MYLWLPFPWWSYTSIWIGKSWSLLQSCWHIMLKWGQLGFFDFAGSDRYTFYTIPFSITLWRKKKGFNDPNNEETSFNPYAWNFMLALNLFSDISSTLNTILPLLSFLSGNRNVLMSCWPCDPTISPKVHEASPI